MPAAQEIIVALGLFLAGAAALAYALYKQKEKPGRPALALAVYCMLGVILFGWRDSIIPTKFKALGIDLETAQAVQKVKDAQDAGLGEIQKASDEQKSQINDLNNKLDATKNALQQSQKDLNSEIDQANAKIQELKSSQARSDASVKSLDQSIAPRQLTPLDKQKLKNILCSSPHSVAFQVVRDQETANFADQLIQAFTSCGWQKVNANKNLMVAFYASWPGLEIKYRKDSQFAPQVAEELNQTLGSRFAVKMSQISELRKTDNPTVDLFLLVGTKPLK
jgi:hypothetical protein